MGLKLFVVRAGFFLLTLLLLYVAFTYFKALRSYLVLSEPVEAVASGFRVLEQDGFYILETDVSYLVDNQQFTKKLLLEDEHHFNEQAALLHLRERELEPKKVWYNKEDPGEATLYRHYPWKQTVNFVLLVIILGYFLGLRWWILSR